MKTDNIIEICIDENEYLFVKPQTEQFLCIYRAGLAVQWDNEKRILFSCKPREISYFDWFERIIEAAKIEYDCELIITSDTNWLNIPNELKKQICE